MVFICGFVNKTKSTTLKSINGYASWTSLVCFFLVLQILSFLALQTMQNVYLLKANRQNVLELSILDHAKHMIRHNNQIRLCHTNQELILENDIRVQDIEVHLLDQGTYIECDYFDVCMKIYYDDKAIVSVDIDEH